MTTCDRADLVIRPRAGARSGSGGSLVAAAGWLVASILYLLRFHGFLRIVLAAVDVAVAVGVVGAFKRSSRRAKLTLTDKRLVVSGFVRDRVRFVVSRPARVVEAEIDWGWASGRKSRLWLLVNAEGRTEVGLNRDVWDAVQLDALRERLGLPLEVVEKPMRPAQARKEYPGTIPWWVAHPVLTTYLLIAMIVAVVVGLKT